MRPLEIYVFGGDLQKQLKDIGDVNKTGAKVQSHREPHRNPSGYANNNNNRNSFSHWNPKNRKVSKDEHKEEAVTIAHVPDTVKCPVANFVAGNIAHHISDWRLITSDPRILEILSGNCIDFVKLPYQSLVPNVKFS